MGYLIKPFKQRLNFKTKINKSKQLMLSAFSGFSAIIIGISSLGFLTAVLVPSSIAHASSVPTISLAPNPCSSNTADNIVIYYDNGYTCISDSEWVSNEASSPLSNDPCPNTGTFNTTAGIWACDGGSTIMYPSQYIDCLVGGLGILQICDPSGFGAQLIAQVAPGGTEISALAALANIIENHGVGLTTACNVLSVAEGLGLVFSPVAQTALDTFCIAAPANTPPTISLNSISVSAGMVTINGLTQPQTAFATISSVVWNWGDGTTSTSWFPATHTYSSAGSYTFTATSTDSNGLKTSASETVTAQPVAKTAPTIKFTSAPLSGDTVTVNGTASATTPGATISSIFWSWGDGSGTTTTFPATHTYSGAGNYKVTATATDSNGLTASANVTVTIQPTVTNTPPTISLNPPTISGNAASIGGSASATTSGATISSITWNWGDGASTTSTFPASHTYTSAGTYTVTATAKDSNGLTDSASESVVIALTKTAPTIKFSSAPLNGNTVTVNGSASANTAGATISSIVWNWGDGTSTTSTFPASHTFATSGNFKVTATATDSNGLTASASVTVTIQPTIVKTAPTISLNSPTISGNTASISGQAQATTAGATISLITWNWGDGTTTTTTFPASHTYANSGSYTVTATATDSNGLTASANESVVIPPKVVNTPPTISLNKATVNGEMISINGVTIPTTSGATITSIAWNWGDGTSSTAWFPATHTYANLGTYKVTATTTDSNGLTASASESVTVATTQASPTAPTISLITPSVNGNTVSINGVTLATTPGATITSITWNWGDGTSNTAWFPSSHTYASPGTYTVTAMSTDSNGLTASASVTVTIP